MKIEFTDIAPSKEGNCGQSSLLTRCFFCVPGAPHLDASDWVCRESQRKSDGTPFQTSLLCSKANREQPRVAVLLNRTPLASAHSNYLEDWTARGVHVFFVGALSLGLVDGLDG